MAWVGYCLGEIAHRLWIGVPIFFVISGYCIAATADSSRRKSVGYLSFTARRIRRIFPPYLICLGISVALVAVAEMLRSGSIAATNVGCMHRPWWYSGSKWVGNISLTELWRYHFFGSPKGLFLGHAWTLCYEEQFYGVTAVILLVCPRRLFTALLVLTVACPFVVLVCGWNGVPIDGFFFDGAWTLFACGLLVYWSLNYGSLTKRAVAGVVLAITLAYAARDPSRLLDTEKNSDQSLFVAAAFALLGLLGRRADGWLTSRVWLRPLFACGTMCYSLYLVHFPVTVFLNAFARQCGVNVTMVSPLLTVPIGIAASVAVAWLFYHTVERRFLNITGPKTGGVTVAPAPDSISLTPPLYADSAVVSWCRYPEARRGHRSDFRRTQTCRPRNFEFSGRSEWLLKH